MKLLIALSILNIAINATKNGSQATNFGSNEPTYDDTPSSFALNDRFLRATTDDVMKQSVERMQMIARLTNAIYLQKELANGATIKIEKLISELLHFGPTTPTLIHGIKENEIEAALADLENLPAKIEESDELTTLEKTFNIVDGILKLMPDVTDIEVWPGESDYKTDMNNLKDGKIDKQFIERLVKLCADHVSNFPDVTGYQDPYSDSMLGTINKLKAAWSGIIAAGSELKKGIPQLFKFTNNKKNAQDSFNYMEQVTNGINKYKKDHGSLTKNPQGVEKLRNNVKIIMKTVNGLTSITDDLKLVNDFSMVHSTKTQSTPIEYTIGLPDGYNDINQLINHFNNPWFAETVKDKRLEEAFRRLKMWRQNVDNILKPLDKITEEKVSKISEVFLFSNQLVTDFSSFDDKDAEAVDECINTMPNQIIDSNEVDQLGKLAKSIDDAMDKIGSSLIGIREYLDKTEHFSVLDNAVKLCDTVTDEPTLNAAVKRFNEDPELKSLQTVVGELKKKVDAITGTNIVALETHATDSVKNFKSIEDYLNGINPISQDLNCFLKSKSLGKARAVVSHTKTTRSLKDDSSHKIKFQTAVEVVKTVAGTKADLKSLEDAIKGMKGFKSQESDYLNLLANADDHYKVIGLSTEGIVSLKKVIDKKSDLDILKQQANLIKSETKTHAKNLDPNEKKLLDELASLDTFLDPLYTSLDTWKNQVSKLNMTTLPNYSMVFTKAKTVSALAPDIEKMGSALDKLIELVTAPNKKDLLKKVRNSLKILDGVGMKYASYTKNFDQSEKSLEALDLFFVNRFARASVTPAPQVSSNSGGQAAQSKPSDADSSSFPLWAIIVIIVVGGTALSAICGGCVCCRKKLRKTNRKKSTFHKIVIEKKLGVRFLAKLMYQMKLFREEEINRFLPWSRSMWDTWVNDGSQPVAEVIITYDNRSKRILKGNCTGEEILNAVWNNTVTDIVMLCQHNEVNVYFPPEVNGELRLLDFVVRCTERSDQNQFTIRKIELQKNGETKILYVHQHTGYAADMPPENVDEFIKIWNRVKDKENVIVQCADGARRTGAFIMLELMYQAIYFSKHQDGSFEFSQVIKKFRNQRLDESDYIHFAFAVYVLLEILFRDPGHPTQYIGDLHDSEIFPIEILTKIFCRKRRADQNEKRMQFLQNIRTDWRAHRGEYVRRPD